MSELRAAIVTSLSLVKRAIKDAVGDEHYATAADLQDSEITLENLLKILGDN